LRDTPTRIRCLAVFAECLAVGLANRYQRRPTGSGSALEALRDNALYKNTRTLLFYFLNDYSITHENVSLSFKLNR